jgi:hypothetical protein
MAQKQPRKADDPIAELLRDLLIVELVKAGVSRQNIRRIVRCDLNRVTRTARYLRTMGPERPA